MGKWRKIFGVIIAVALSFIVFRQTAIYDYIEDNSPISKDTLIIPALNDESGKDYDKFSVYKNGGSGSFISSEDGMTITVDDPGKTDYAVQLAYSGFPLYQNCEYKIQFDIRCDKEGETSCLFRKIEGDRTIYWERKLLLSREPLHVEQEWFMMEESDPCALFLLNLGNLEGEKENSTGYTVSVDNFGLSVKNSRKVEKLSFLPDYPSIVFNQLGYRIKDEKVFHLKNASNYETFTVVDADTGNIAYEGALSAPVSDPVSGAVVQAGDFSHVTNAGNYEIRISDSLSSPPLRVSNEAYDELLKGLIHMLYLQRCGEELPEEYAGDFSHAACHQTSAVIMESEKTREVSGGWHDAGDYGRYVVPGTKTVVDLLLAFEKYNIENDNLGIPESGNGIPDLLDEVRYELEWMLKMQDEESGGVYHQVTTNRFISAIMPEDDEEQLFLAPISDAATADFCAAACKASTIYSRFDRDFSALLKHRAILAWNYLKDKTEGESFTGHEGLEAAVYKDTQIRDELFWAAAEIFLTGENLVTIKDVKDRYGEDLPMGLGWSDVTTYALYDIVRQCRDSLDPETAAFADLCEKKLTEEGEALFALCQKDVYHMAFGNDYYWGSNMRAADNGVQMLLAYELTGEESFRRMAKKQMDYILGLNNLGYCFVTGMGYFSSSHPHHSLSQILGTAVPGMLTGGVNSHYNDDYARSVLKDSYPAMCYVDHERSYSTNEVAIYYNSALFALSAEFTLE